MEFKRIVQGVLNKSVSTIETSFQNTIRDHIAKAIDSKRVEIGVNVMNTSTGENNNNVDNGSE